MPETSRAEHSIRNATVSMASKLIAILFGYLTRVVFIRALHAEYVGVNGLLFGIVGALNLYNLGVNTALAYLLYRPAAEDDRERQAALLQFYHKIYKRISLLIAILGMSMYPILLLLFPGGTQVHHLLAIYGLFVLNAVVSYWMGEDQLIHLAKQEHFINEIFDASFLVLQYLLQMLVLVSKQNYLLYLVIYVACTLARNLFLHIYTKRRYPYLYRQDVPEILKEEKRSAFLNIRAMLLHKVGQVVINNTDNLILTGIVGLTAVGQYANYTLIIGSVRQIVDRILQGMTGSVGNLGATSSRDEVRRVFGITLFLVNWIYGISAIILFELLNPFIELSFGRAYVFSTEILLILIVNFYLTGMRQSVLIFRDALGLFRHDRYKTMIEAAVNLAASVVLAMRFGTAGVFIGTAVSILGISFWVEPYVLYHFFLKESPARYFWSYLKSACSILTAGIVTELVCRQIGGGAQLMLLLRLAPAMVLPNLVLLLFWGRSSELRYLLTAVLRYWKRKHHHETTGSI